MSCKYWDNPDKGNIDQDNNAIESIVTKVINSLGTIPEKSLYRETCGPSSLEAVLEALGVDQSQCGRLQPSDYYALCMNDKRLINSSAFKLPVNRYIEAYGLIMEILYPKLNSCLKLIDNDKQKTKQMLYTALHAPDTGCIINLKNPGHYIAGLHIDDNNIVTYNDSWLGDYFNPSPKHKRTIEISALVDNMKNGFVVISL